MVVGGGQAGVGNGPAFYEVTSVDPEPAGGTVRSQVSGLGRDRRKQSHPRSVPDTLAGLESTREVIRLRERRGVPVRMRESRGAQAASA